MRTARALATAAIVFAASLRDKRDLRAAWRDALTAYRYLGGY